MRDDVKCRLCPKMISTWRMFNMDGLCPECWEDEPCTGCSKCEEEVIVS